jgi:crotonobetainyl-CoA:carnitine CoA-transferase CaiB-like acyl-CoA transferase
LYGILGGFLATKTNAEWVSLCESSDIPFAEVHDLDTIVADPKLHRGVVVDDLHPLAGEYRRIASPVHFSGTPVADSVRPAPLAGGDTDEILQSIGYSDAKISELRSDGAVR